MSELEIIGSEEWCVFEQLGIPAIKARVDSGAKTSSIQATNMKVVQRGLEEWVKFEVNPLQENRSIGIPCTARLVDRRMVKSSTGISEERLVVRTPITLGNNTFEIELTLANRDTMEFRMLLGREALMDRYMVNPSIGYQQKAFSEKEIERIYAPYYKEKSGLKIALLASNPNLYSNKRIVEAAKARGHEIVFLNVELAYMKLDAQTPEIRYRGGNILNEFDAVIPRIKPAITFYGCALSGSSTTWGYIAKIRPKPFPNHGISCSLPSCSLKTTSIFPPPVSLRVLWTPRI